MAKKQEKKYNIPLDKGAKLSDYIVHKKLSSGGFSIVYLAYHKSGLPVAIKEYFPAYLHLRQKGQKIDFINMREKHRFQEGLKAFKAEMEIIMQLKHKNIIEIINFFEMNGTAYIVMPYEYGLTLSKYISLNELDEAEVIKIAMGVFSAVDMFHDNGIIHLDLKPGNIWLRPDKEALILDFGTARMLDDIVANKIPPMHTPGYAAPEQHREFFTPERIGKWTDYYALGATLYALLEHNAPIPSNELMKENKITNLTHKRRGQVSDALLNIAEELMELTWEKRQNFVLKKFIERMGKVRPIQEIPVFKIE